MLELIRQVRSRQTFWQTAYRLPNMLDLADKTSRIPLWYAAANQHLRVIGVLLDNRARANTQDDYGVTPLTWALYHGHDAAFDLLTQHGARLRSRQQTFKGGMTPLMKAASQGHEIIARFYLDQGVEVNARHDSGKTALMWAAGSGHIDLVRLLLDAGADVSQGDQAGNTALLLAASRRNATVVKLLLDHGSPSDGFGDHLLRTSLSLAHENNDMNSSISIPDQARAGILERHKARPIELPYPDSISLELCDSFSRTRLVQAARRGQTSTVDDLLAHGADLEAVDCEGHSALWYALHDGLDEVVKHILMKSAAIYTTFNGKLWSALISAVCLDRSDYVSQLIAFGAHLEAADDEGHTALWHATQEGYSELVGLLLSHDTALVSNIASLRSAQPAVVGLGGDDRAADADRTTRMAGHLDQGIEPECSVLNSGTVSDNIADDSSAETTYANITWINSVVDEVRWGRWLALIKAARLNRRDYADFLMLNGADINAKDDHGRTALWHARLMDSGEVIDLLLEWGADIYVVDHIPRVYWTSRYRQHRSTYQRHQDRIELANTSLSGSEPRDKANQPQEPVVVTEHIFKLDGAPLVLVPRSDDSSTLKTLLDHGAPQAGDLDEDSPTALMRATKAGQVEAVEELIRNGSSLEDFDSKGRTALLLAIEGGHTKTVDILLQHGAEAWPSDTACRTALALDRNGRPALALALHCSRLDIATLLRAHGVTR